MTKLEVFKIDDYNDLVLSPDHRWFFFNYTYDIASQEFPTRREALDAWCDCKIEWQRNTGGVKS